MKILLVDHEAEFAGVLAAGLREVGHQAVHSTSSKEALVLAASRDFALALVEYTEGGRQFLREYRESDPLLPVVVLTDLPSIDSAVEFLRGGPAAMAIDYIVKVEPNLIARLEEIIDRQFTRLQNGPWLVNRHLGKAWYEGQDLKLTRIQMDVFTYLMQRPYEIVGYEAIAFAGQKRRLPRRKAVEAMRSGVSRLRKKLEQASGRDGETIIRTVGMEGLKFIPVTTAERSEAPAPV